jgi:hypothetical protein
MDELSADRMRGGAMDAVSLIVAALAAGAAVGGTALVNSAMQDAYAKLKAAVRQRLAGRRDAQALLDEGAADSADWRSRLAAELTAVDAGSDPAVMAAAIRVIAAAGDLDRSSGVVMIDCRGVQTGAFAEQHNDFRMTAESPG